MVTTFGVPSLVPMTGATVVIPFSPFLSTRPASSQLWNPRTSEACGHGASNERTVSEANS